VSVTAERLLYRSKQELSRGDYTLSIVIGTMAVESYLTRLFFKVKGMDSYATTFTWPTEAQEKAWESEYPKKGGFTGPADFVAKATTGMTFDEFIATNTVASNVMAGFSDAANGSAKQYFQSNLFYPRNRIAHWGYVNVSKEEAERCHALAVAIVSILREMDRIKYASI
jgi:HEPN domain-containing protein